MPRAGDELAERRGVTGGVAGDHDQQVAIARVEQARQRHRVAPLGSALAPLGRQGAELVAQLGGHVAVTMGLDGVTGSGDAVDGLAQRLVAAAIETELGDVHDGFVTDVHRGHAAGVVDRQPRLGCAERGDAPPVRVGGGAERRPRPSALVGWADRIG
jgi:hypothetical protein